MRNRTRLATTAGATVLTFVALGGVAQADPRGDAAGNLTNRLGGVLDAVTGGALRMPASPGSGTGSGSGSRSGSGATSTAPSRSSEADPSIGVAVTGPVQANTQVRVNSSPGHGTQAGVSVHAGVRQAGGREAVSVNVNVGVDSCGFAPELCGQNGAPQPPVSPPGAPPGSGAPPATPPGVTGPAEAGPIAVGAAAPAPTAMRESLPFTGGPLGTLAELGLAAVLAGSAAVAASRFRTGRQAT